MTPGEFDDPADLQIGCHLKGDQMQEAPSGDMVFSMPRIVEFLSSVLTCCPVI